MGLFDHWPYTNLHELNLTWLLRLMEDLSNKVDNFVALNTIKYADPIQWNITTQYEPNTVVVDPQTGTAYISTQPVPSGVGLTNTDYWSVIFTLDMLSANDNITLRDDGSNILSTFTSNEGDWLLWNGNLYRVSQSINLNEAYVVGYNLTRYTVEMFINDYIGALYTYIGSLSDLTTADQDSIVDAINELVASIGDLSILSTTDQSSTVAAINELYNDISSVTISFANVAEMIASDKITNGEVYRCDGYYTSGDKGFGFWVASTTADTDFSIESDNGLYLTPIPINGIITANQFGAYGDGTNDDTLAIQSGVDFCGHHGYTFKFVAGRYCTTEAIDLKYRNVAVIGEDIGTTTIELDRTNATHNVVFRFIGYLQWGMTFGNFTITGKTQGGSGITFGDEVDQNNGHVYHSHFLPMQINNCGTAIYVASGTTAFWGCIFDQLIFGANIGLTCIDNTQSAAGAIPNNRFCHVTTYSAGTDNYQRSAMFYLKGYNQIFENVEILNCRQLVFRPVSGGRITINNMKLEAADYTNGSTWLFYLDPYSHINITEMSLSGDFSQLSSMFYSTSPATCSVNVRGTIRFDDTSGTGLSSGYSTSLLDTRVDIITSNSNPPLPNYSNDNLLSLGCLATGATKTANASTNVDASIINRVVATAASIVVNFPSVNNRRLSVAANLSVEIVNTSAGAITVSVDSNTVGTVAANTTKHLVEYGGAYHIV